MFWMRREHNTDWNRRNKRDFEWERAMREFRAIVLFVSLSFVLGMFIKNVSPIAVLGEFLRKLFDFCGFGQ